MNTTTRVYLKGLENGKHCFSQVGDILTKEFCDIQFEEIGISPITWIEVL